MCLAFIHSSQYLHSQDEKSNQYLLTFPLIQNDFLLQQIISCAHFTSWCYVENTMGHLNLCWDYDSKVESKTRYAFFLSLKCCTTKISCCIVEFIFAKNIYTFLTKKVSILYEWHKLIFESHLQTLYISNYTTWNIRMVFVVSLYALKGLWSISL